MPFQHFLCIKLNKGRKSKKIEAKFWKICFLSKHPNLGRGLNSSLVKGFFKKNNKAVTQIIEMHPFAKWTCADMLQQEKEQQKL